MAGPRNINNSALDPIFDRTFKIWAIIGEHASEVISDDDIILSEIGLDEIDMAEVAISLEDGFGIEIDDDDITEWKTVGNISDYINKKLGDA
jgi:acyl carrier protein